jgi:hypothetical protein
VNGAEALAFIGLSFVIVKVLGPIAVAIGHRLRGRRDGPSEHRLAAEVDEVRTRLAEVEERLDFAERLLARGAQADQIPGGAQQ